MKLEREKGVLDPELASMSLDNYYEKHVKKPGGNFKSYRPAPYASRSQAQLHFQRTHYFGPAYRRRLANPTSSIINSRLEELSHNIEHTKTMVAFKIVVKLIEDRLEQQKELEASLASMPPPPSPTPSQVIEDLEDTLILTIGDEMLHDDDDDDYKDIL
ncbi:uncharacterized protein LOC122624762 [Drosophila teissieri]|uniref:uncharacterized protein LOC122624762 n=1 Tax=Drosophila teissieri TaxID=7243 RepID=UPI001CB9FDC8|nr:uncharacterized protein LOC122624762 [Drosophila teissieri]